MPADSVLRLLLLLSLVRTPDFLASRLILSGLPCCDGASLRFVFRAGEFSRLTDLLRVSFLVVLGAVLRVSFLVVLEAVLRSLLRSALPFTLRFCLR